LGEDQRLPMVNDLETLFPNLRGTAYRLTSPRDKGYNCIAWATGAVDRHWWLDLGGQDHWPAGVARVETIAAFHDAFATLGYVTCSSSDLEADFEKVAVYANAEGVPTHAARQLPNGRWTSKVGKLEDIEHELPDLEGTEYGSVVLVMRRPVSMAENASSEGVVS
jgi:hypothetical protein